MSDPEQGAKSDEYSYRKVCAYRAVGSNCKKADADELVMNKKARQVRQ